VTRSPAEIEAALVVLGAVAAAAITLGLSRRDLPRAARSDSRAPALVVAAAALVAFVAYALVALAKLHAYNMGAEDLGRVDQAIWSVLEGRALVFSASEIGRPMSRLAGHVELLYVALAPLFLLWNSAAALLVAQAALAALGAWPAYRIGRREGGSGLGVAIAIAYLAHPAFGHAVLADVHGDTLAMPLLLFALDHGLAGKRSRAFAFLALAVLAKEYVAALAVTIGLYFWLARRDRRLGLGAIALGLAWITLVVPAFHRRYRPPDFPDLTPIYFGRLGRTPGDVVRTSIARPGLIAHEVLTPRKAGVVALLFAPFAFTPLAAPAPLLLALPVFGPLAVSEQLDLRNHHNATLLPFLVLAAAQGARRVARAHAARVVLAATAVVHLTIGASPFSIKSHTPGRWDYLRNPHLAGRTPHDAILDRILAELPAAARLSVSGHLVPAVSHRETCFAFPAPADRTRIDVAVVDLVGSYPPPYRSRRSDIEGLERYLGDPAFRLVRAEDGIFVVERRHAAAPAPAEPPRPTALPGSYAVGPLRLDIASDGAIRWTATRTIDEPILVLDASTREVRLGPSTPSSPAPWPAGHAIADDPARPIQPGTRFVVLRLPEGFPAVDPSDPPQPWMPDPGLGERLLPE
jgi:uncharacterized membrane protein